MKTQGKIEGAIAEGIGHFEREYMGRGPKDVHAYLLNDLIVVRLRGVLRHARRERPKVCFVCSGPDETQYAYRFFTAFAKLECQPIHLSLFKPFTADLRGCCWNRMWFTLGVVTLAVCLLCGVNGLWTFNYETPGKRVPYSPIPALAHCAGSNKG
jgi:hypothetical protein